MPLDPVKRDDTGAWLARAAADLRATREEVDRALALARTVVAAIESRLPAVVTE